MGDLGRMIFEVAYLDDLEYCEIGRASSYAFRMQETLKTALRACAVALDTLCVILYSDELTLSNLDRLPTTL